MQVLIRSFANRDALGMNSFSHFTGGTTACSEAWGTSVTNQRSSSVVEGSKEIGKDDVLMKLRKAYRK